MATSGGRRLYQATCGGRGHLRTRSGRDQPRGYAPRIPSVRLDDGLVTTPWSANSGVTKSMASVVDPDGNARTRVRFVGTAANTNGFIDWIPGGTFTIPPWAHGIEIDIWMASPGYPLTTSNGVSVDIRLHNTAFTQAINVSAQKLTPGWNRIRVHKSAFATTAGTAVWGDATAWDRIRMRIAGVASHTHDMYIGGVSWAGTGRSQACVMFDDNRQSVYDNAFPLMAARGIPGTMFSNSDFLAGGTIDGLTRMTGAQLLELKQAGWEVCNHGRDHASGYGAGAEADALAQIADGFTDNGTLIGNPEVYASPFGDFSDTYLSAAADAGVKHFRGLFQTGLEVTGSSDMWLNPMAIPCITVADSTTPAQILAIMDGIVAAGGSCNLLFHGIEASGGVWYSVANFTTVMDGIVASSRRNNYDLVTFTQAIHRTCM